MYISQVNIITIQKVDIYLLSFPLIRHEETTLKYWSKVIYSTSSFIRVPQTVANYGLGFCVKISGVYSIFSSHHCYNRSN